MKKKRKTKRRKNTKKAGERSTTQSSENVEAEGETHIYII